MITQDYLDLEEEIHEYLEEYLDENMIQMMYPEFFDNMVEEIADFFFTPFREVGDLNVTSDPEPEEFKKTIRKYINNYFEISDIYKRSYKNPKPKHYASIHFPKMEQKITNLQNLPLPAQRTPEWYQFRNGLITASNIWKVFGTEANKNSLILEKCKSVIEDHDVAIKQSDFPLYTHVNTDSPMHWGCKYEPLTVKIYEYRNHVTIGEFGCIRHPQYSFLGASPDGIVISKESPSYGRMLEIKNIVNREIDGIPSMPYWIQMQLQMEVCDLDECDFVETLFKEVEEDVFHQNKHKYLYNGVILYFITREYNNDTPFYVYMPIDASLNKSCIERWVDKQKQIHKDKYVLFKRLYWYCDIYSCVFVKRSPLWFHSALPQIKQIWETIEQERISGFEHRFPKKRNSSSSSSSTSTSSSLSGSNIMNMFQVKKLDADTEPTTNSIPEKTPAVRVIRNCYINLNGL